MKIMSLCLHLLGTLYQTMFVTLKVIAIFYPNLKLSILTFYNHIMR